MAVNGQHDAPNAYSRAERTPVIQYTITVSQNTTKFYCTVILYNV
jgi:hypothetical protein